MSNKVLRITLDDNDPLVVDKELGVIIVNSDEGSIDWIDTDGASEHILVFDPTSASPTYMKKSVYDINNNNIVDDAENLGGVPASDYATQAWVTSNTGSMSGTTYDIDNSGVVDNSERLGGQLPSYYASTTWCLSTFGDMNQSVYDSNASGVVDNSELLNGELPAYYLDYNNFTNLPTIQTFTGALGDVLQHNGTTFVNTSILDLGTF